MRAMSHPTPEPEAPFHLHQLGTSQQRIPYAASGESSSSALALDQAIASSLAGGWRLESRAGNVATMVSGRPTNHVLHLLLTVLTAGLWAPVWLVVWAGGGEKRATLLEQYGRVTATKPERVSWVDIAIRVGIGLAALAIVLVLVFRYGGL